MYGPRPVNVLGFGLTLVMKSRVREGFAIQDNEHCPRSMGVDLRWPD
jgi:hypothetical protein